MSETLAIRQAQVTIKYYMKKRKSWSLDHDFLFEIFTSRNLVDRIRGEVVGYKQYSAMPHPYGMYDRASEWERDAL